jgi:hypothetical protein
MIKEFMRAMQKSGERSKNVIKYFTPIADTERNKELKTLYKQMLYYEDKNLRKCREKWKEYNKLLHETA